VLIGEKYSAGSTQFKRILEKKGTLKPMNLRHFGRFNDVFNMVLNRGR